MPDSQAPARQAFPPVPARVSGLSRGIGRDARPTENNSAASSDAKQFQGGLAALRFEHRYGRTRLTALRTISPLHVQRVLYPDDRRPDLAHVIVANPTAGLLSGDQHAVDVYVETGARARVSTQAATKVFSMPRDGEAELRLRLTVENGGFLEYLSHALIPFHSASLHQSVEISVASGGTAIYGDVLGLGRVESGERLAFRSVAMNLTVRRPAGDELYIESYRLQPPQDGLDAPGVLGTSSAAAVSTLVMITDDVTPSHLCEAWQACIRDQAPVAPAPLPGGGGAVLKAITTSAAEAEIILHQAAQRCTAG
jgi:urease accessory protein